MLDFLDDFFAVEQMTARMVNNINGVIINDLSLNVYVFGMIFLVVVLWIFFDFYKNNFFNFKDLGRKTLIIIFIFWALMEIRTSQNYISYAENDYKAFFGKTLDQKRAETPTTGLYQFVQLIKEKTPKGAKIKFFSLNDDFVKMKLKYYLAPTHFNQVELEEAEYVAGYGVNFAPRYVLGSTSYGWVTKK
ncbi:hypothetical protein A3J90_01955 [candidate division WOR-1 bacterium RIFOXYC2_FULL_37_10]|uniref:Uncharacterized protein n=1 Tax=candidate division WOR-1 bacterium RIFOXYB2_FULL_37_13 TaxID=1802579 RepID=A0A1F4SWD4_UNCSA|nr:MAG: hypothetical protein A2246_02065 [candidate division WOR-1 bacterium RIFOXYA2_FULL_37_7]OGC24003.1 MAG: hypothetical protein A2310_05615 [candidate division WOR-1 bacterium RIFOXYB2_FULL_37_13]OGC33918.1 MAG: hypothetical protein A3J90_01955 [candidate division WOR-1 bacterium RIFOXYC2_FULL_37_10]